MRPRITMDRIDKMAPIEAYRAGYRRCLRGRRTKKDLQQQIDRLKREMRDLALTLGPYLLAHGEKILADHAVFMDQVEREHRDFQI